MESCTRHFVLIHGACHGAWCWYKVATILKSLGHRVTALDLAAAGVHPKQVTDIGSMSDYAEPLMEFMAALPTGERVVLVGHSMGGVSISMAMEKFPEKISVGVFAAAFMPGPELTREAITKKYSPRSDSHINVKYTFDDGLENPPTSLLFGSNFMSTKMYQLSPPEDFMLANYLVRPIRLYANNGLWGEELKLTKEKYGLVRRVYIMCDQDNMIKEDIQRWMIKNNPTDEVKVVSGSDHMVMFTKPQEFCLLLQEIIKKYM